MQNAPRKLVRGIFRASVRTKPNSHQKLLNFFKSWKLPLKTWKMQNEDIQRVSDLQANSLAKNLEICVVP